MSTEADDDGAFDGQRRLRLAALGSLALGILSLPGAGLTGLVGFAVVLLTRGSGLTGLGGGEGLAILFGGALGLVYVALGGGCVYAGAVGRRRPRVLARWSMVSLVLALSEGSLAALALVLGLFIALEGQEGGDWVPLGVGVAWVANVALRVAFWGWASSVARASIPLE